MSDNKYKDVDWFKVMSTPHSHKHEMVYERKLRIAYIVNLVYVLLIVTLGIMLMYTAFTAIEERQRADLAEWSSKRNLELYLETEAKWQKCLNFTEED